MFSLFAVILALAPGVHAWWTGRSLLARANDPAFPELVFARTQRRVQIATVVAVVSAFVPGTHWFLTFPLFGVALLVGGFPFRRTLYGETWSVASYVRYTLFGFIGTAGFWLTTAFAPVLIFALVDGWTPGASPLHSAAPIGALFAVLLAAWEHNYPLIWLALHRASPIERADLESPFDDIIRRSTVSKRPPQVFRFGVRGAYIMNAFALPSVSQPRVAFSDTLLELLTPDEIVAVFAHEVSHLEHFDRRRLLRLRLITYLLILGGTALPALLLASAPAHAWMVKLVWPIIVVVLLALRASKSQAHETESDLRAAVLTGDPEAMVRALTKLHHYSRMPRRWPYDFERAASHPSLARRIQALRTQGSTATSAMPAAQLGRPTVLRSTEPGAYAALDDGRAYWFDGVPAEVPVDAADSMAALREQATSYRAVAYADLTELRVAVVRAGRRALLARDRAGKTWSMPLRPDDVAAAQHALDILDIRLGNHVREDWATKARVMATLLAVALVGALDFSWPWIPLLITLAKPSRASVAAMGSMVIGRIVLGAIAGTLGVAALGSGWQMAWLSVIAAFGISVWACRLAWRWARGDERPNRQPLMVVTLAILALLLVSALAITTTYGSPSASPLSLPTQGPAPAVAILLLGVGAAFLTYRDSLRRRSGAALAVVALAIGGFGVDGQRLLTRSAPGITWTTGHAELRGRVDLNGPAYKLHLSPRGDRFAVQSTGRRPPRYEERADEESVTLWKFTIASVSSPLRTTEALDLAFVDDERVLVLRPAAASGDSLELSVEQAVWRQRSDSVASWRLTIPADYAPTLGFDRVTGTWSVTGTDVTGAAVTTVGRIGRIGSDSVRTTRLSGVLVGGRPLHTYRDGTSLITTLHGSYGKVQMVLALFGVYPFGWDIWHIVNGERRSAGTLPGFPECGGHDETLLCLVLGPTGMTLWRLEAGVDATPRSLGVLPREVNLWDIGSDGQIAAASRDGAALALVDARLGRGTRVALGGVRQQGAPAQSMSYATDVAVGGDVVAILFVRERKSEVTFYRVK